MPKKIEQIETKLNQNNNNLSKIQKFTIKINSDNFLKRNIEIPILVKYTVIY
jgi:hypothetical protein